MPFRIPKGRSAGAALAFLALFVLPYLLPIVLYSHFDKDVVYLRGGGAAWMLNPEDRPVVDGFPVDFPAAYSMTFRVEGKPLKAWLALNAVKSHELRVNGRSLSSLEETAGRNWKFAAEYDLSDQLRPGENTISVLVRSPDSVTALRARGEVIAEGGGGVSLDSGEPWLVASQKTFPALGFSGASGRPLLPSRGNPAIPGGREFSWPGGIPLAASFAILVAAAYLFPSASSLPGRLALRVLPDRPGSNRAGNVFFPLAAAAVFSLLAWTLWGNLVACDAAITGDYQAHRDYLEHFLGSWRIPLADEGFQMYNPPLYHLLSAALFRLFGENRLFSDVVACGQLVNTAATLLAAALTFCLLRRLFRDSSVVLLAFAVAAFLPMSLYRAPSISGDSMAMLIAAATFYCWLLYAEKATLTRALLCGLLAGIGLLTRYTMLFVFLGACVGFLYLICARPERRRETVMHLVAFSAVAVILAGPYYARNVIELGQLFPINGQRDLFLFRQPPGYRDRDFYALTFLAGTYGTIWFDGQHLFLARHGAEGGILPFVLMGLALFPTLLFFGGTFRTLRAVLGGDVSPSTVFGAGAVAALALSWASYVLWSFKMPYDSAVKGFYLLHVAPSAVCLAAVGLDGWIRRTGRFMAALLILALCGVVLRFFGA